MPALQYSGLGKTSQTRYRSVKLTWPNVLMLFLLTLLPSFHVQSAQNTVENQIAASITPPPAIVPSSVIAVATLNLTNDVKRSRLVLARTAYEGPEDADVDLYLYLPDEYGPDAMKLAVFLPHFACCAAGMFGLQPEIAPGPRNNVQIISQNESVGRNRWRQTLTVALKDNVPLITGYTFDGHDTLDMTSSSCDVNFLNGKAIINGKARKHNLKPFPLSDWNERSVSSICP